MTHTATYSAPGARSLAHTALLYRDPEHLRRVVSEFVRGATDAGEPLLVALPPASHTVLTDVLDRAGETVERVDMAEASGNPSRLLPMLLQWMGGRPTPMRVVSEALWPERTQPEVSEVLRHEALLNHVLSDRPVSVLCPFDAARLDGEILAGAELTHPQLIDETGLRPSDRYGDPLDLARGDNWPQSEATEPVIEVGFTGDLWALRHALAAEPLLDCLAPQRIEDLVFVVNEAVSNTLRHGDGRCTTRLWRGGDRVVVEVRGTSPIEDPLAGLHRPAPEATSGRGLWLINQLSDLVELRSAGSGASIRMHFAVA